MLPSALYRVVQKKFLHVRIFRPSFCPLTKAANAQPISPDGTCVTELSKVFFARPCMGIHTGGYAASRTLHIILSILYLCGFFQEAKRGSYASSLTLSPLSKCTRRGCKKLREKIFVDVLFFAHSVRPFPSVTILIEHL